MIHKFPKSKYFLLSQTSPYIKKSADYFWRTVHDKSKNMLLKMGLLKIWDFLHPEVMFLDVFICLFVCLSVFTIIPKLKKISL